MLIFIEGPDGSGKTTLIKKLCPLLDAKHIFTVHKDVPNQYDFWKLLIKYCSENEETYVMDRCFLSDWVYRAVLMDGNAYMSFVQICNLLNMCDGNVAYVFCKSENAYENATKRGEDYITDKETHTEIANCYKFISNTLKNYFTCNVFEYDFSKDNIYALRNEIRAGCRNGRTKTLD